MQLEIAVAEGQAGREIDRLPGKPLDALGLEAPTEVPCVSVRYQIAQKLHACTETPSGGRTNDRFRDLIDLLLLEELIGDGDWAGLRTACEEIFELRSMHPWPPTVTVFAAGPRPTRRWPPRSPSPSTTSTTPPSVSSSSSGGSMGRSPD